VPPPSRFSLTLRIHDGLAVGGDLRIIFDVGEPGFDFDAQTVDLVLHLGNAGFDFFQLVFEGLKFFPSIAAGALGKLPDPRLWCLDRRSSQG
jgi:hypothetical protein